MPNNASRASKSSRIKIGNETYTIMSDDDYLLHIGHVFEPDMCRLFLSVLEKNHTVLDIGANIGCTSILFGQTAKEVISFEPSPTTFKYLELNINNSGLTNVKLHNVGLGSTDENLTLTFAPNNRSGGFVSNQTQASAGHNVENISIKNGDAYIKDTHVDFMKIDVEGFEMNVLQGLANMIQKNKPIVVAELNHWCLNAFQRISIPDYFDYLLSIFPILYAVDDDKYADLRDAGERYAVMYHHINYSRFPNIVGAFEAGQVSRLLAQYSK